MSSSSTKGSRGLGCLVVFGAVFFLAGMVPGAFGLRALYDWSQASAWVATQATIVDTGLERGDDTFRATARYRYSWDGRDYEGTRVSLHSGSDNIGDFHQQTYSLLEQKRKTQQPVTAYVDPDNPSSSVVVRDMRWGLFGFLMIFPLVFGGAGAGIIAMGVHGKRREARKGKLQQQYPEEPWRWHPQWQDGTVRAQTRKALWFAVFFTLVWNLISLPLPFFLWSEVLEKKNYVALVGLLFPLVGIGLIVWTVRSYLQHQRYGRTTFRLDTFPGSPGGELSGMLSIPGTLPAGTLLDVTFSCIRRRTSGSGKNRSTSEDILWQDQQRLRLQQQHVMHGTRVHLAFPVPADQPPTDDSNPRDSIQWRVHLYADVPGVDFDATLEVPVFHTRLAPEMSGRRPIASAAAEPADWTRTGIVTRFGPRGREFYAPPARHKAMATTVTVAAALFSGATALLWHEGEIFMGVIFGLFAVLLLWFALSSWLLRSRILPTRGLLRYRRGIIPGDRLHELPGGEIAKIRVSGDTTFGRRNFYDLVVSKRDGSSVKIADTLSGRRDTEAFAEMIAEELGIRS